MNVHGPSSSVAGDVAVPDPPPAATPVPAPSIAQPADGPRPAVTAKTYGPQPGPAPHLTPRRRCKSMMTAGFVTFGTSYVVTVLLGAYQFRRAYAFDGIVDERARGLGTRMLVPVIGPLLALARWDADQAPSMVLSFLAQLTGLSLGIIGAVRWTRGGRRVQAALHLSRGVRLGAAPRLGGGPLNLTYHF